MTPPLVSCVMPVFNGERFLAEALGSILCQTHSPTEVIVVDDGSTDRTPEIVESFGDRVRYVYQDNAGPAPARNTGIELGRGDFFAFLDADDLWDPLKLARQLDRFRLTPELGFSVTLAQNFWEDDAEEERERMQEHRRSKPIPAYVTGTLVARREWMEKTGGFDPSLHHGDAADWFSRADALGAVGELLEEVMLFRRLHGENRSRMHAGGSRDEFLKLLKARLDRQREARG